MNARIEAVAGLVIALAGFGAAQEIHLKTRNISVAGATSSLPAGLSPVTASDTHQLVQFDHAPNVEDLDALLAAGARVVGVVPDNAVVVRSPGHAVAVTGGIVTVSRIDPSDKISPALSSPGGDGPFTAVVEFHPDVTVDEQNSVAAAESIALQRTSALVANHAIAEASLKGLQALAAHDEVVYIFPADPALLTDSGFSACAGMLTLAGPVAQYANLVHGWDTDSTGIARLGYVFGSLTTKAPAAQVQSEILRALNAWSQYTNVAFEPGTSATAARTVAILFASGAHGDAYPFDGPGGILAHTFYPVPVNPESIAGDMHLDADENWHVGGDVDIYSVALHEAGHAIGLAHSDKPGDVMYPYYRRGMTLSANDIGAAQTLYGVPAGSAAPVTAPVTASPLRLTLNASPVSTQSTQVAVSGTVAGGAAPLTVQWQTDHGYSGLATLTGQTWTASGIELVNGSNTISVTVFDSQHVAVTQSTVISLAAAGQASVSGSSGGSSSTPVSISISTPSSSVVNVNSAALSIAGTASGGAGVTKITWQSSDGCSGVATGTSHWLASMPVMTGTNTVIVRAYDANGASAWAALVVVRN